MNPVGDYNYMLEEMKRIYNMDMSKKVLSCMLPGEERIHNMNISNTVVGIIIANANKAFVKEEILDNIEYANMRSGNYIDFFFAGYSEYNMSGTQWKTINGPNGKNWYFSVKMFNEFIEMLERKSTWKYSGETELLLLEFKNNDLCFDKVISIWIDKAVREESIYSVSRLFEIIYQIARDSDGSIDKISNKGGGRMIMDSLFDTIFDLLEKRIKQIFRPITIFAVKNYSKKE